MTRLRALILLLLLSSIAFSQIDTSKVRLSKPIAKKIAIELVQCDSIKEELKITQTLLWLNEQKNSLKDSVVIAYIYKEESYKEEIKLYNKQAKEYEDYVNKLKRHDKILAIKSKVFGIGFGVTSIILGTLIFLK